MPEKLSPLMPMNDYIIVEPIKTESALEVPGEQQSQKGRIVEPGKWITGTDRLDKGDIVYYVLFSADGQTIEIDGKEYAHVKHERIMSRERSV